MRAAVLSFSYLWAGDDNPSVRDQLALWCANQIWPDTGKTIDRALALGVFKDSELVAVMAYHNYDPDAGLIELSGAAIDKRWLTRRTLWEMYSYPFDKLKCQIVIQRNDPDAHINRMCRAYGFSEYRIPRLRGRNKDEIIMTLTDEQWRSNGFHKENAHG